MVGASHHDLRVGATAGRAFEHVLPSEVPSQIPVVPTVPQSIPRQIMPYM